MQTFLLYVFVCSWDILIIELWEIFQYLGKASLPHHTSFKIFLTILIYVLKNTWI